jgi:hypothetical protein
MVPKHRNACTEANIAPDNPNNDYDTSSAWYQNIVTHVRKPTSRQKKCIGIKTSHLPQIKQSPTVCAASTSIQKNEKQIMSFTCKNQNSTLSPKHYHHQQTDRIITTNTEAVFRHPLTTYPFFSRNPLTMTVLSRPTPSATMKSSTASTNNTMLSIAACISAKVINTKPKQPKNNTNHAWNTVGRKVPPLNQPFLPKTIPTKTITTTHTPGNDYCISLSIQLNEPNWMPHQISTHQLLTALLNAKQLIHPNANIGPRITDDNTNDIKLRVQDSDDIPTDDETLTHYIELPDTQNHDRFCTRIYLHSDINQHHHKNKIAAYYNG